MPKQNTIAGMKVSEASLGAIEKSKITKIEKGKRSDFFGVKYFEKYPKDEAWKAGVAIRISCENGAQCSMNLTTSTNGEIMVNPKSSLAKWKTTYGKYPEIGDSINTQMNEFGTIRVIF
jgi:hypothetical protein